MTEKQGRYFLLPLAFLLLLTLFNDKNFAVSKILYTFALKKQKIST